MPYSSSRVFYYQEALTLSSEVPASFYDAMRRLREATSPSPSPSSMPPLQKPFLAPLVAQADDEEEGGEEEAGNDEDEDDDDTAPGPVKTYTVEEFLALSGGPASKGPARPTRLRRGAAHDPPPPSRKVRKK